MYGKTRNEIKDNLAKNGIYARKYFYPLTNEAECFYGRYDIGNTPIAKHISRRVLTLPMYSELSKEDVVRICDIILENKRRYCGWKLVDILSSHIIQVRFFTIMPLRLTVQETVWYM